MKSFLIALIVVICLTTCTTALRATNQSFIISPDGKSFLKDGKPFQIVSGSVHYFRSLRTQWNSILSAARAAGLNAIQFYVPWNYHNPSPGVYDYHGDKDLQYFLSLAQSNGLLVLLRAGPYSCGEWEFGGFPWWMLKKYPNGLPIRTNDPRYMAMVTTWWKELFPLIARNTYNGNGGPIVMVQVENEYGSYGDDHAYLTALHDFARGYLVDNTIIYSTDGGATYYTSKTAVPGVFQVVDFGPGSDLNSSFAAQHQYSLVKGPDMNAEYYTGWLTHWGDGAMAYTDIPSVLNTLDAILARGASVNFYMFHGGTNYAFWNGANNGGSADSGFQPSVTSYDYDGPLTEAGDPTPKYFAMRNVIGKYVPLPNTPLPVMKPKGKYGQVKLTQSVSAVSLSTLAVVMQSHMSNAAAPIQMEVLGQAFGYVTYQTQTSATTATPVLNVVHARDYLVVMVNGAVQGYIVRGSNTSLTLSVVPNQLFNLTVLVENAGRINYGAFTYDPKGMINVWTLNNVPLTSSWTAIGTDYSLHRALSWTSTRTKSTTPVLLQGTITIPGGAVGERYDSFLDMRGFGRGVVWVNGVNIGRFSNMGPQYSLYVAKEHLNTSNNVTKVVVLDLFGDLGSTGPTFDSTSYNKQQDNPYTPAPN